MVKKLINTATKVGTSKCGKKMMDTTKKQGSEFAKIADKKIVQRSAEATGDLIGNKIADKITALGKSKEKKKKMKQMKKKKLLLHQKRDNKSLMTKDCFRHSINMEYQKIKNLLGN